MQFFPRAAFGCVRLVTGICVLAPALGGCVDTMAQADLARGDVRAAIAQGQLRSPRPAVVALSSIEGAPAPVLARLKQAIVAETASRDIAMAEPTLARYFVRVYLDAYPTETGTLVTYVWDVFDADKRRTQRLDDTITLPTSGADPWSLVDDRVLATIAGRSADDLAVYLAGTPEATNAPVAAASAGAAAAVTAAVAATPPLGAQTTHVE